MPRGKRVDGMTCGAPLSITRERATSTNEAADAATNEELAGSAGRGVRRRLFPLDRGRHSDRVEPPRAHFTVGVVLILGR